MILKMKQKTKFWKIGPSTFKKQQQQQNKTKQNKTKQNKQNKNKI